MSIVRILAASILLVLLPQCAIAGCVKSPSWAMWETYVSVHSCHPVKHHAHKNVRHRHRAAPRPAADPSLSNRVQRTAPAAASQKDDAGTWNVDPEKTGNVGMVRSLNACLDQIERTPHVYTTERR